MKLIELHNFQDDGFKEAERGTPSPCIGEVVIKVHAASLNFRDFMIAKGLYNPNIELPLVYIFVSVISSNCLILLLNSPTTPRRISLF